MLKYGSDKLDLCNFIEMQIVSEYFVGLGFVIFVKFLEQDGIEVCVIFVLKGGLCKFCDWMNKFVQEQGLFGMGYIFWCKGDDGQMEVVGLLVKNIGFEWIEVIWL